MNLIMFPYRSHLHPHVSSSRESKESSVEQSLQQWAFNPLDNNDFVYKYIESKKYSL